MRKISKTRSMSSENSGFDAERSDTRPRRIHGATITSWSGPVEVDLDALFARPCREATVAGAPAKPDSHADKNTISLSDGTEITFSTS